MAGHKTLNCDPAMLFMVHWCQVELMQKLPCCCDLLQTSCFTCFKVHAMRLLVQVTMCMHCYSLTTPVETVQSILPGLKSVQLTDHSSVYGAYIHGAGVSEYIIICPLVSFSLCTCYALSTALTQLCVNVTLPHPIQLCCASRFYYPAQTCEQRHACMYVQEMESDATPKCISFIIS